MNQSLDFNEFPPCDSDTWLKLVTNELAGKPLGSIVRTDENGFSIDPYLTSDHPVRGVEMTNAGTWQIAQTISETEAGSWNKQILESLAGGTQYLTLDFKNQSGAAIADVLKNVMPEYISIRFLNHPDPEKLLLNFIAFLNDNKYNKSEVKGSIQLDLNNLSSFEKVAELCKNDLPGFRFIEIDTCKRHNAGATASQEIAIALCTAHDVLSEQVQKGLSAAEINRLMQFDISVASSYFTEIAKICVLKNLWRRILKAYDNNISDSDSEAFVYAETSLRSQYSADIHNNQLRATTQAMSAILAGAAVVDVKSYTLVNGIEDANSLRLARNIQHLLLEESYFDRAGDAVNGSYFINNLIDKIADISWKLFVELDAISDRERRDSKIAQMIENSDNKRKEAIEEGKRIIVGVNKYQPVSKAKAE